MYFKLPNNHQQTKIYLGLQKSRYIEQYYFSMLKCVCTETVLKYSKNYNSNNFSIISQAFALLSSRAILSLALFSFSVSASSASNRSMVSINSFSEKLYGLKEAPYPFSTNRVALSY